MESRDNSFSSLRKTLNFRSPKLNLFKSQKQWESKHKITENSNAIFVPGSLELYYVGNIINSTEFSPK